MAGTRRTRWIAALAVVVLVAAACGDSDSDDSSAATDAPAATEAPADEPPADDEPTATDAPADTEPAASGDACPDEPFTGTIERTAESETSNGVHPVAVRSDGELVSAYAYYFGFGGAYTIYVGDYEIEEGAVGIDTLMAPHGGMLTTIFIQEQEEIAAGDVVEFSFVSIVDTGGGSELTGFGADEVTGQMTIIDVTDERLCFEIESSDPQQEITGTVSAVVVN
ncbi:MAG: hypothetical protein ACR2O6_03750 [Ilumatobacteraceae bacterium]